jgi:hypothetical protein
MQLTREYQHRSQYDFSGALAGTPDEARRYWDSLTQAQKEQQENIDTFMNLYNAEESTSQSAEASSQHGQGQQRALTRAEAFSQHGQGQQRALTRRDFASEQAYRNHLARQKGIDNDYQYRNHLAQEKGFNNNHDYRNDLAQKSGFNNQRDYQKHSKKRDKSS